MHHFTFFFTVLCCWIWGSACTHQAPATAVAEPWKFVDTLLLLPPERCQQMIRDRVSPELQHWTYQNLYYRSEESQHVDTVLRHLQCYERLFPGNPVAIAFVRLRTGSIYLDTNRRDTAIVLLNESLALAKILKDSFMIGESLRKLGNACYGKNDLHGSLDYALQALEYFREPQQWNGMFFTYCELSQILIRQKEFERAYQYARKAAVLVEKYGTENNLAEVDLLFSINLRYLGRLDSAYTMGASALARMGRQAPSLSIVRYQRNLALVLLAQKRPTEALVHIRSALDALKKHGKTSYLPYYNNIYAACLQDQGHLRQARTVYEQSLDLLRITPDTVWLVTTHDSLAAVCAQLGDFEAAARHSHVVKNLERRVFSGQTQMILKHLNARIALTESEKKVLGLEKEQRETRFYYFLAVLGCALLAVGGFFTVRNLQYQRAALRRERDILVLQEQTRAQELELKDQKLRTHQSQLHELTRSLVFKNEIIRELEHKMANWPAADPGADAATVAETQHQLRQLSILTEAEWREFLTRYDRLYPGQRQHLLGEYPDLTPAEVRIFLLLKLGLDNYQLSSMLGISGESVRKSRYRLKKKLALSDDANLTLFVQEF